MQFTHARFPRAYWLFPAFLGANLYLINLPGTWIYDDLYFAHDDPRLHGIHRWRDFLTQEYFDGSADKLWRPLVSLSFASEWGLHGEHAWPFHLVNLLLHAAVCILVAKLGRRLSGFNGVGLVAGLLFAAHPIHVEAVTGIVGRAEEMCTLGFLAAMLLVIDQKMTTRRALAATGCFLFAALSKEQGILLPFILLGWAMTRRWMTPPHEIGLPLSTTHLPHLGTIDYSTNENKISRSPEANAVLLLAALLTGTLAIYISYRNSIAPWYWEKAFLEWPMNPLVGSAGWDRWLIPVAILGRYAALLIAPWRLAPDYSANVFTSVQPLNDPFLWLGVMTLILFALAGISALRRRDSVLFFCLGCLAITYFLAGNIILIGTVFGERLMYLPSVFVCILTARQMIKMPPRARAASVTILLIAFCIRTETYAWQWNDRLRFYRYAAQVQPKSSMVYLLLGDELQKRHGDLEGAARAFAAGKTAAPNAWRLWNSSAEVALLQGRFTDAEDWARHAFKLHPGMETSNLIGEIVERAGTQPFPPAGSIK